ncbi:MAG: EscF/YscF/HrpA family type III secretion system needle major subunit, partial [Shewanella sp.]|nr:EscF/YscF/HrpA family type III secretion system needle major subunit [Shewanella sp.]
MDLSAIVNQLSQLSTRSAQEVQAKMSAGDLTDPDKMIKAQFA